MARAQKTERDRLFDWPPTKRLEALRQHYPPEQQANLTLPDGDGLALLLASGEGIPFTCYNAGEPMIAFYGLNPLDPQREIVCRGYLTLARLKRTKAGRGRRVRSLNELYVTPLSATQVERLLDFAHGRAPRLGVRQRLSPLAARLAA